MTLSMGACMRNMLLCAVLLLMGFWQSSAHAHKPSDSYLKITVADQRINGQWDIALRDLDYAIGLDSDGNGEIIWDEVRARHEDIAAYAMSRLELANGRQVCPAQVGSHLINEHTDGAYAVLRFHANCPSAISILGMRYTLFADIDPQHRGLLNLQHAGVTTTAIFGPDKPSQSFKLATPNMLAQFAGYVKEGIWHIWIGFDHILFLLSLLLPAVLVLNGGKWQAATSFKAAFIDVLKIVTAFTLAHSITLTLATLHIIVLPSRWVEAAIAASVVVAALNNIFPILLARRWIAAFVFGLIHGFGFASVLADLGLPQSSLLLALVGFNLGVEVGQLAIVSVFLPAAYALRHTRFYQRGVIVAGSVLIVLIALAWFIERAFNMQLLAI